MKLTTTLGEMLAQYQYSPADFLCDLVLFMQDPSLQRLADKASNDQFSVNVIDVFLEAFPTRISTSQGRMIPNILEWCVDDGYLDSSMMSVRGFRKELLTKLIAEFGDVELTFTINDLRGN